MNRATKSSDPGEEMVPGCWTSRHPRRGLVEFVAEAIRNNLLLIPGNVFSRRDTHFRLSYADDRTLQRGLGILDRLAR
jgi:aspartate aminotransferase/aminotransferase